MKFNFFILTVVFTLSVFPVNAESVVNETNSDEINSNETETAEASNPNKLFVTFNYGATASWLTRIIEQSGRSNFVLKDFLPGLYFNTELQNMPYFIPTVRIAAYYPLISTFNDVPQVSKTPLHFAADLFAGVRFKLDWNLFTFSTGPGLHMFFMTADRWNYLNLGVAAAAGFELAISSGWTLFVDGFASFDYGNLGTNKDMELFDIVFQYQTGIGVRYSKKLRNKKALFMPKHKDRSAILDR